MIATRKELDETDHKIIDNIKAGYGYKEIAQRLYLTKGKIRYRIRVMKEEFNCKTLACLIAKIS